MCSYIKKKHLLSTLLSIFCQTKEEEKLDTSIVQAPSMETKFGRCLNQKVECHPSPGFALFHFQQAPSIQTPEHAAYIIWAWKSFVLFCFYVKMELEKLKNQFCQNLQILPILPLFHEIFHQLGPSLEYFGNFWLLIETLTNYWRFCQLWKVSTILWR